jgi:hypothetical protein
VERITASREAWLSRAIEAALTPEERPALDTAIELLQRIADVDLRVDTEPLSSVGDAGARTLAGAGNRSTTTSETP